MKPATLLVALFLLPLLLSTAACKGCDAVSTSVDKKIEETTTATSRTGISVELKLLRGQIEIYRRMNGGANPPSLQAMDTLPRLKFPDEYSYDPSTGVVSSKSHPSL